MNKLLLTLLAAGMLGVPATAAGDDVPFVVADNLFDANDPMTMGLQEAPGTETVTVFAPSDDTDHYSNGVVMAAFKGDLYCMWQSSQTDEDAADTWVAYSRSTDGGKTWAAPMVLAPTISDGYCSSGGWVATEDRLIGYINTWPDGLSPKGGYTRYVESTDGLTWTEPQDVTMADGSRLTGIMEQDPHVLADGRIVGAAHFQPGLLLCPIYTDDPTGRTGWKKGAFVNLQTGNQSYELEPSFFVQADGTLVMTIRDQGGGSYHVLAATSSDRGETWTQAAKTDMPDSRAKQSAGNLPDGTAYIANNPGRVVNENNKTLRVPLALTLSADGKTFDRAYLLRGGNDLPAQRYAGKSKTLGYSYPKSMVSDGYLYVAYSTNKDDAQYTRVPLSSIMLNTAIRPLSALEASVTWSDGRLTVANPTEGSMTVELFDMGGAIVLSETSRQATASYALNARRGIYLLRIKTQEGSATRKLIVR